ncbi:MAG TPA: FHA domain-containing protein [Phycisphaerales bacterium]|nr:FHA domain-containing protein [Phycisphaerales bacterium]
MSPQSRTIRLFHNPTGAELNVEVKSDGLIIGRSSKVADLTCTWDNKMSRRHGKVWLEGGDVWYEDLGSSNGSWVNKGRVTEKVKVEGDMLILIGETSLTLVSNNDEQTVTDGEPTQDGMTVQAGHRVSRADFASALSEASQRAELLDTLTQFVNQLLGAANFTEIAPCLRSLYRHLPTAKHIYLIRPPSADDSIIHLIEPELLARDSGDEVGTVSRSLARMAIERGEALLFSQADNQTQEIQESTRLRGIHSAAYVPLLSKAGDPLGVLCVDSPLSHLPLHEENLTLLKSAGALLSARIDGESLRQEAQQKEVLAREADARKEALASFLKIASHDLKNPLTVAKMCGVLISRMTDSGTVADLCERLLDAERRAEQLISTYLEVSELQSTASLTVKKKAVSVHDLIEREFQFLEKAMQRKNKAIDFRNQVAESVIVSADPQKLQQIINNLIGNAIKYGREENPRVEVKCDSHEEHFIISVTDNGVGISEEDQTRLFAQFQRVGDTQHLPGTGLGLWLSNLLVQAHGGEMWVESEPGWGSTFFFSLPR